MADQLRCYIKDISFEDAKAILLKAGSEDGTFLIIDSSEFGDFKLVISFRGVVTRYTIHRDGPDAFFSLGRQTHVQGLDRLIDEWRSGAYTNLPTLRNPCTHERVEQLSRNDLRDGRTNHLHRAVMKGELVEVQNLLEDQNRFRYAVDAKNLDNQTAVHLACKTGNQEILRLLIERGASVTGIDVEGNTPLHYACALRSETTLPQILLAAGALANSRNPANGRCPLHEAAEADNLSAIKVLLEDHNVPLLPYTVDSWSPIALARHANSYAAVTYLNEFVPRPAKAILSNFYHRVLSRESAEKVLSNHGLKPGMFLVRVSADNKGAVLTLYADRYYHYIISEENSLKYIDLGPRMPSLEHLIDYYSEDSDGLAIELMYPVSPQQVVGNSLYENLELKPEEADYYKVQREQL